MGIWCSHQYSSGLEEHVCKTQADRSLDIVNLCADHGTRAVRFQGSVFFCFFGFFSFGWHGLFVRRYGVPRAFYRAIDALLFFYSVDDRKSFRRKSIVGFQSFRHDAPPNLQDIPLALVAMKVDLDPSLHVVTAQEGRAKAQAIGGAVLSGELQNGIKHSPCIFCASWTRFKASERHKRRQDYRWAVSAYRGLIYNNKELHKARLPRLRILLPIYTAFSAGTEISSVCLLNSVLHWLTQWRQKKLWTHVLSCVINSPVGRGSVPTTPVFFCGVNHAQIVCSWCSYARGFLLESFLKTMALNLDLALEQLHRGELLSETNGERNMRKIEGNNDLPVQRPADSGACHRSGRHPRARLFFAPKLNFYSSLLF